MSAPNDGAISRETLLKLLRYDPNTGYFGRRVTVKRATHQEGAIGHVEVSGYRRIYICGKKFAAHRLAWFYMTGEWPEFQIDHKNLNKDDNRWKNLRQATPSQNRLNIRGGWGQSGLKGAQWNERRGRWQSYLNLNGKSLFLGRFDTAEEAHAAYCAAAEKLHGEFLRTS